MSGKKDNHYMLQCIELAKKGAGYVSPNPLVGCVIVKSGKVIGRGYHKKFGEAHAEVNAIINAKRNGYNVKGSVLYVNLEPCSHTGKTPPCTDLIINEGIKEVVVGMRDPNPKVNGLKQLKESGIKVSFSVLKNECEKLNKFFVKNIKSGLPYVTLKIAQSIDGKIADKNNKSKYITGSESRKLVHKMRAEYDAILVGAGTVFADDPYLNVRDIKGSDPLRVILTGKRKLPKSKNIFADDNYIIFKSPEYNLREVLITLTGKGVSSILVEGGAKVFSEFIDNNLADEVIVMTAPVIIGEGLSAFEYSKIKSLTYAKNFCLTDYTQSGKDLISYYKCSQA